MWQLKSTQPAFEMVDGPMAGRAFVHGLPYDQVPPGEAHRFERPGMPAQEAASDKTKKTKAAQLSEENADA